MCSSRRREDLIDGASCVEADLDVFILIASLAQRGQVLRSGPLEHLLGAGAASGDAPVAQPLVEDVGAQGAGDGRGFDLATNAPRGGGALGGEVFRAVERSAQIAPEIEPRHLVWASPQTGGEEVGEGEVRRESKRGGELFEQQERAQAEVGQIIEHEQPRPIVLSDPARLTRLWPARKGAGAHIGQGERLRDECDGEVVEGLARMEDVERESHHGIRPKGEGERERLGCREGNCCARITLAEVRAQTHRDESPQQIV